VILFRGIVKLKIQPVSYTLNVTFIVLQPWRSTFNSVKQFHQLEWIYTGVINIEYFIWARNGTGLYC